MKRLTDERLASAAELDKLMTQLKVDEVEKWVRERAAENGKEAGVEYAEAFKAFRFVDDEED